MRLASMAAVLLLALSVPVTCVAGLSREVDQPTVCFVCHGEVEEELGQSAVHAPVEEGACSSCHNPHASRHAALLAGETAELCGRCHASLDRDAEGGHSPFVRGECLSCHAPHASDQAGLLKQAPPALCADCHPPVESWLARSVVHPPVDEGDCAACHDPHRGEGRSLLAGTVTETCGSCHDRGPALDAAHGNRRISDADCTACHDPHASEVAALLRPVQHAPFASGRCQSCHRGDLSAGDFAVADVGSLCERCHAEAREFLARERPHNLNRPGSCVQCHQPHAAEEATLLRSQQDVLCMSCHFEGDRFDRAKSAYRTHPGVDCSACHDPHGGSSPHFLRPAVLDHCGDCHEQAHRASHPTGPEVIDPRTGESVTCLSCHQLHGSEFEKYLPLDPTRDLCLQCHRR